VGQVGRLIAESARQWQLSSKAAAWLFWIPLVGAVAMAAARLSKETFRFFLREDGVLEWAQFVCFAVACLAGAGVAWYRFAAGHRWQAALFALFTLAMLFVTGEEIAWGQRVLDLETPECLDMVNKQNEITLHNIGSTLSVLNLIMLLGSAWAASACLINKGLRLERIWAEADYLFVPPFFLASSFLVVFGYQLVRHVLLPRSGFTVTRYGEWSEFCLAFGIAVFVVLNYRRLARQHDPRPTSIEPEVEADREVT